MEGILVGITHLKQELDAIDEELGLHIRKTRDIESQILRTSEEIKILSDEETSCQAAIILQESRIQSLAIVSEKSQRYLLQERHDLQGVKEAVKETTSKIRKNREEFMSFCSLFQKEVESVSSERQRTVLEKNALHEQIVKMNSLLDAAKVTRQSILQEKTQYCEKLTCENKGLYVRLQDNIINNDKIIEEIESHNKILRDLLAISNQMSGEIQENEDAMRQLKDLVMGLQIQLSNLLGALPLNRQCLKYCAHESLMYMLG